MASDPKNMVLVYICTATGDEKDQCYLPLMSGVLSHAVSSFSSVHTIIFQVNVA